jgi:methyl-accepting chemotaxis protein
MRVGYKIALGFAAVLLLTAFVGIIGWTGLNDYAGGVGATERMNGLVEKIDDAGLRIARFRASGDGAELLAAATDLSFVESEGAVLRDGADDAESQEALSDMLEAVGRYQAALGNYATLNEQNVQRLREMLAKTVEIEETAVGLHDGQQKQYAALAAELAGSETELQSRRKLAAAAEKLIRATLEARQAEAMYQLSGDASHAKRATKAIRNMFMASLAMKKMAAGTPDEKVVAKVMPVVNAYRKNFGKLMAAFKESADSSTIEAKLNAVSKKINAFTSVISRRQQTAVAEVTASTAEARARVDKAVAAQENALKLVALARQIRLAEQAFLKDGGGAEAAKAVTGIFGGVFVASIKLKKALTNADDAKAVNAIATAAKDYRKAFTAVAEAVAQQTEAEQNMGTEQETALRLVKSVQQEVNAEMGALRTFNTTLIVGGAGGAMVIGIILAFIIGRGVSGPLGHMTGAMRRLADGELETEIPAIGRRDEIGEMADAVQVFKESAQKVQRMEQQREAEARRSERKVQSEVRALNNAMDEEVQRAVSGVMKKTDAMQTSAQGMAATAEETNRQSTAVAAASEQASTNVQTVASAAEQLSGSVAEISRQVAQSSQIAGGAVREAEQTNQQIQGLAQMVDRIGEVVSLINDIADQTNLLALNATIEAARAGEAGKGFAVVASEVKNLANQTAKATDEIGNQIDGVQTATNGAVTAIESIGRTIGEIDEIASAIAAAVEEQGAATQEIARNVEQAAAGTREVSGNIAGVTHAAGETGQAASGQLALATEVGDQVRQMQERLTQLTADSANPHLSERHTVNMAVKIAIGGAEEHGLLHDISRGGVAVLGRSDGMNEGVGFEIDIRGLGRLPGAVIASTGESTHARFDLDDAQTKALDEFITSAIAKRSHKRSA